MPTQLSAAMEARWLAALPTPQRERLERDSPAARAVSLTGLALLRAAFAAAGERATGVPARLIFPRRGKPLLPGARDFSIAHAGDRVACVLAPEKGGRIGLDLEPRGSVTARQLRLVTSTAERLAFGDDTSDATALWVAKEAALKCVGMGIERIAEVAVDAGLARHGAEQYALLPVAALAGYTVCIAQSGAAPAVEVSLIEHEALPLLAALPCAEAAPRFHVGRA